MKYPTHPKGRQRPLAAPARGMCGIFHEGCFPSLISQGNGVILRVFLYWLVYFTCICRIDEKLVTLRKFILNPRKAPERLGHKDWEDFANKKFWSPVHKLKKCAKKLKSVSKNKKNVFKNLKSVSKNYKNVSKFRLFFIKVGSPSKKHKIKQISMKKQVYFTEFQLKISVFH